MGGAVHSVGEGQMEEAGVARAAAVDEVDFQVLQEGAIVGTKNIPQVSILEADTHQVVELVAAVVKDMAVEVVEMTPVIAAIAVWMDQVTRLVITATTDLQSPNANV